MRISSLIFAVCYFALMAHVTYDAFYDPYMNWDVFGYVGSVVAWSGRGAEATYDEAVARLHEGLPPFIFFQHIQSTLCSDSRAFSEQLPIYQVKPLYNAMIWLLGHLGFTLPAGSWLTSNVSFALLAIVLFRWKTQFMPRELWLLMVLAITFLTPLSMASLAYLSTPDSLATLMIIGALSSWLMYRKQALFGVLCLLAQLARPDAVIITGALFAYFTLLAPDEYSIKKNHGLCWLSLFAVTYLAVNHMAGGYNYGKFFIYSLIFKFAYPAEFNLDLTPQLYWDVVRYAVPAFMTIPRTFAVFEWSAVAAVCFLLAPRKETLLHFQLLAVSWASLSVRFLLFPSVGDDRYYFAYFLVMLYCGGEILSAYALPKIRLSFNHFMLKSSA